MYVCVLVNASPRHNCTIDRRARRQLPSFELSPKHHLDVSMPTTVAVGREHSRTSSMHSQQQYREEEEEEEEDDEDAGLEVRGAEQAHQQQHKQQQQEQEDAAGFLPDME